ncbi:DNA-directed RNA polymerase subunit, partial [Quillaja saponaria]
GIQWSIIEVVISCSASCVGRCYLCIQAKFAECPLCNSKRSLKDIRGREISYTITAEDIRRELGIVIIEEQKVQLSKVNKKCEKCGHDEANYYTRQMRSADEGQTTFYTCTRCSHQFQEN